LRVNHYSDSWFQSLSELESGSTEGHVSGIFNTKGKENNSTRSGKFYVMGQAKSGEKALSQEMGQEWFNHTNCHLTEKVKGVFSQTYTRRIACSWCIILYMKISLPTGISP